MLYPFLLVLHVLEVKAQTCPPGETWYRAHPRSAYEKADGTPYSAAFVTGHCRSKSKAHSFWLDKLSNGKIAGWPHNKEKVKHWSTEDIERFLKAVKGVPEVFWRPIKIFRADKSETKGNHATHARGIVVMYDSAFGNGSVLSRVLLHELGHQIFDDMKDFEKTGYLALAGWHTDLETAKPKLKSSSRKFVSPDGAIGPGEDFANNLEHFVFDTERLKFMSPAVYDWFAVEYGDKIKKGK